MSILDDLTKAVEDLCIRNTQGKQYTGEDCFRAEGNPVFSVLDFWQFMYSQLDSLSGDLAEFIVAQALGVKKAENSDYWSAYDMSYRGRRIEVKETRYIHPWNKKRVSQVRTFSIAPTNNEYWSGTLKLNSGKKLSRQSDVYVFCLNTNQDFDNQDPLDLDHWEFYIVPTFRINEYTEKIKNPDQKKISLGVVRRLAGCAVKYNDICSRVEEAIEESDRFLLNQGG